MKSGHDKATRHRGGHRRLPVLTLLGVVWIGWSPGYAAEPDPDRPVPQTVQDLAWGEVLFDFFQDRHVPAITRLLVARERAELVEHEEEAELVLGGLYLGYGMHRQASTIFERLLERHGDPAVRDQAWYFLAQIRYQRGDPDGAAQAIGAIGDALPPRFDTQRYDLAARILLDQGRPDEAARLLADADLPGGWRFFGLYNLGVALIRSGDSTRGQAFLDEVGRANVAGPELTTLRDRANLALGYERLLAGESAGARQALDRVRLDGPYTTRALLGAGWAEAGQDDFRRALKPWLALGQRNRLDIAVQESLLAVPYAYGRLGANVQAVEHYQRAVDLYEAELLRLDAARAEVEGGALVQAVMIRAAEAGGPLPYGEDRYARGDGEIDRYLLDLLAGQRFQVAAADLRETQRLRGLLDERAASMDAMSEMLAAQRARYADQRPRALATLDDDRLSLLRARHTDQEATLRRVRENQDVMALASARERRLAARIGAVQAAAEEASDAASADRARFLSGVLYWRVHEPFFHRLRAADKASAATDRVLVEAEQYLANIRAAGMAEPDRYAVYEDRIAAAVGRLEALRRRTSSVILAQSRYLEDLAVAELVVRRERVTEYLSQARFALAASYDRAAVAETSQ